MNSFILGNYSLKIKIKKGECFYWHAGNYPSGYIQIRWNGREFRYEGYDGTGNSFFFSPFNERIYLKDALLIIKNQCGLDKVFKFINQFFDVYNNKKKIEVYDINYKSPVKNDFYDYISDLLKELEDEGE